MSLQDPISDMLTRIRNAQAVGKAEVLIGFSNLNLAIAQLLKDEGYILDCQKVLVEREKEKAKEKNKSMIIIQLKYYMGAPVISELKRVSRPGLRQYKRKDALPKVKNGLGIAIV